MPTPDRISTEDAERLVRKIFGEDTTTKIETQVSEVAAKRVTLPTLSIKTIAVVIGLLVATVFSVYLISAVTDGIEKALFDHKITQDEKPIAVDDKASVAAEADANVALTNANTSDQQIQVNEPRIFHLHNELNKQNQTVKDAQADRDRIANATRVGDVKFSDLNRKLDQVTNRGNSNR